MPASLRRLAGLADRADAALAAGRIHRALLLYSEAYRLLPDSIFEAHFAGFARAAAAAGAPADADPVAYQYALDGDDALRRNDLGEAIHQYRLAVAEAPWWAGARTNLAVLLDVGGDRDAANAERAWAARLPAGSSPGTLAVTSSVPLADEGAGSRWYEDSLADAVAGGGALLAVAGGVLYWIGRSSVSQANATSDLDVYDAARARAAIEQPLGLSLLGAGAAALATGVVLYHHDRNARGGDDVLSLAPAARGGLVTFEGGF